MSNVCYPAQNGGRKCSGNETWGGGGGGQPFVLSGGGRDMEDDHYYVAVEEDLSPFRKSSQFSPVYTSKLNRFGMRIN